MRDHCTSHKCSQHCPYHLPTFVPKLPPCLRWATMGFELIYYVSNLLNEVPKARIKFWKTLVHIVNNSNKTLISATIELRVLCAPYLGVISINHFVLLFYFFQIIHCFHVNCFLPFPRRTTWTFHKECIGGYLCSHYLFV